MKRLRCRACTGRHGVMVTPALTEQMCILIQGADTTQVEE